MRNSLYPQCKTSIGNKSGSTKHRVMKFAYSRGFLAMADRMVCPPYLSRDRDRKWPRTSIRRKTTLWMRVTPVAYNLEQSVMGQKMFLSIVCINFAVGVDSVWNNTFNACNYSWQVAQLLQRYSAAGWVSYGQRWKTVNGRQHFTDIIGQPLWRNWPAKQSNSVRKRKRGYYAAQGHSRSWR